MIAHEAYMCAVFRLGVWGPEQGRVVGQQVLGLMDRVYGRWTLREVALASQSSLEGHKEEFRVRRAELHEPWRDFIHKAARALKEPEEISEGGPPSGPSSGSEPSG